MSRIFLGVFVFLAGAFAIVQANDERPSLDALTGGWTRPLISPEGKYGNFTWSQDGRDVVTPELRFIVQGKTRSLQVSGTPATVYWNPAPLSYQLKVGEGKEKGTLAIEVEGKIVPFTYTVEKNVLTIACTEKVPAGPWLGKYNISGKWVRPGLYGSSK